MEFLKYVGTITNQTCLITTGCRTGYKFVSDVREVSEYTDRFKGRLTLKLGKGKHSTCNATILKGKPYWLLTPIHSQYAASSVSYTDTRTLDLLEEF